LEQSDFWIFALEEEEIGFWISGSPGF